MRTFVVRVHDYRTFQAEADALCGVVEEIATGRRITFTSGAELLGLLAVRETRPSPAGAGAGRHAALRETTPGRRVPDQG